MDSNRTPPGAVVAFCDFGAVYKCHDFLTYLLKKGHFRGVLPSITQHIPVPVLLKKVNLAQQTCLHVTGHIPIKQKILSHKINITHQNQLESRCICITWHFIENSMHCHLHFKHLSVSEASSLSVTSQSINVHIMTAKHNLLSSAA